MIRKIFDFIKKALCVAIDAIYIVLAWIGRSIKSLFIKVVSILKS